MYYSIIPRRMLLSFDMEFLLQAIQVARVVAGQLSCTQAKTSL